MSDNNQSTQSFIPRAIGVWLTCLLIRPDETLAMSYIYLNKYKRFQNSSMSSDPLDSYVCLSTILKKNETHKSHPPVVDGKSYTSPLTATFSQPIDSFPSDLIPRVKIYRIPTPPPRTPPPRPSTPLPSPFTSTSRCCQFCLHPTKPP